VLQSDVRTDLRTLLYELGTKGLVEGGGAAAFNRAVPFFRPAYRRSAILNDALLGEDPARDQQRILRGQQRTLAALSANPRVLEELVTDLNVTARALAREDVALEQSVPALRDTLRTAMPALDSLNAALPTLRAFAREALPGVRSSAPTLDVAIPWIRQQSGLMSEDELRGVARSLTGAIPSLVRLNRSQAVKPTNLAATNGGRLEPLAPPNPNVPPPHRPDVPCETQEPPNLDAPDGPGVAPSFPAAPTTATTLNTAQRGDFAGTVFAEQARTTQRVLESPLLQRRIERVLGRERPVLGRERTR
jgi:hypothetical protein